jgi:uncharacterized protein with NRDE domain
MCLILFANAVHPEYPLAVAANRDEFHSRPSAPLGEWPDAPGVRGGRDLLSGGSWFGVAAEGRWAAVTNYRDPEEPVRGATSRGHLVSEYLTGDETPWRYLQALRPRMAGFAGFFLLVADRAGIFWASNRAGAGDAGRGPLRAGMYGVSNHLLDTPWPKVSRGKAALAGLLEGAYGLTPDRLLGILQDRSPAADHELPVTGGGLGLEPERALSATFIVTPDYGTRSSTAMLWRRDGTILLSERRFDPRGEATGEDHLEL